MLALSPSVQYDRLKLKRLAYNLELNSLKIVKGKGDCGFTKLLKFIA